MPVMFDNGWSELTIMPKLIFNDAVCPLLMHAKPVPALHTFFYYTMGWMTFHQGEYTPKNTASQYGADRQEEIRELDALYGHKCEPPPDAIFCFVMGIGFLILEILVPLVILFIVFQAFKPALYAGTRIVLETAKDGATTSVYIVEKTLTVTQWAGISFGWLAVIIISALFGMVFGLAFLGPVGVIWGGCFGATAAAAVVFSSVGFDKHLLGPSRWAVGGTVVAMVAVSVGFGFLSGTGHNSVTSLVA